MLKKQLLLLFVLWSIAQAHGQPISVWSRITSGNPVALFLKGDAPLVVSTSGPALFDSNGNTIMADSAYPVRAAALDPTGNLVLVGELDSNGLSQAYVRCLDSSFHQKWLYLLPQTSNYIPHPDAVAINFSGKIFVSGPASDSTAFPASIEFFSGLDSTGNLSWSFVFAVGFSDQRFKRMTCDASGNAVIGTDAGLGGPADGEMHFRKYDSNGLFLQENLFDPIFARDVLEDFSFLSDGSTLLTGPFNLTAQTGNSLSALVRFDSNGLFTNYTAYDGFGYDEMNRLLVDSSDQTYAIVSGTDYLVTGESRFDLFKFDPTGSVIWNQRHRDGVVSYQKAHAFASSNDKLLIAGENRTDTTSQYEGLIVAYDTTGALLYEIIEPVTGSVVFDNIVPADDSTFYVSGSYTATNQQSGTMLMRYSIATTAVDPVPFSEEIMIFPTPATKRFHIKGACTTCSVTVFDQFGKQLLKDENLEDGVSIEQLSAGCYVVAIGGEGKHYRLRLLVE